MRKPIFKGELKHFMKQTELWYIDKALKANNNSRAAAARALGLNRTTLLEKMRYHGILEKRVSTHYQIENSFNTVE